MALRKKLREGRLIHGSNGMGLGRSRRVLRTYCCWAEREVRVLAAMEMRALGAYAGRQSARLLSKQGKNLFFLFFFFCVVLVLVNGYSAIVSGA